MSTTENQQETQKRVNPNGNAVKSDDSIVKLTVSLANVFAHVDQANDIAKDLRRTEKGLEVLRGRIVVWLHELKDMDTTLSPKLVEAMQELLNQLGGALQQMYYTLGEKFTAINVEEEFEDVIPF